MSPADDVKRNRMHLRLDASTKGKLERAAAYEQKSVTEFVLATAVEAAERVIEAHETITLSRPDWDAFFDALLDPPEPSEALREGFRRYRDLVS